MTKRYSQDERFKKRKKLYGSKWQKANREKRNLSKAKHRRTERYKLTQKKYYPRQWELQKKFKKLHPEKWREWRRTIGRNQINRLTNYYIRRIERH